MFAAAALAGLFLLATPSSADARAANALLGGGNALARATTGQSQGLANANPASNLLSRLTFASTRGGTSEEVPPTGSTSTTPETTQSETVPTVHSSGGGNSNNNGGAQGGDGGSGGNAAPGGLVRAGDVVSNATAVNAINTTIVRIGR